MALKAGRVGVAPNQVDNKGKVKVTSDSYTKTEADTKFATKTEAEAKFATKSNTYTKTQTNNAINERINSINLTGITDSSGSLDITNSIPSNAQPISVITNNGADSAALLLMWVNNKWLVRCVYIDGQLNVKAYADKSIDFRLYFETLIG